MQNAVTTAFDRRSLVRLTGIAGESVSRRGSRSLNADAVASFTDLTTAQTAFVAADGVGDHLLAARAARTVATIAAQVGAHSGAHAGIVAAQQELLRQFPEPSADAVLVVAVLPIGGGPGDIAWVGDCRAYRWNGRVLHQITTDHTAGEFLRQRGHQPASRLDHLVTTSARTAHPGEIGSAIIGSSHGRFLLCTDGVHKRVGMAAIKELLAAAAPAGVTADALVDLALRTGGKDNTTALVVDHR